MITVVVIATVEIVLNDEIVIVAEIAQEIAVETVILLAISIVVMTVDLTLGRSGHLCVILVVLTLVMVEILVVSILVTLGEIDVTLVLCSCVLFSFSMVVVSTEALLPDTTWILAVFLLLPIIWILVDPRLPTICDLAHLLTMVVDVAPLTWVVWMTVECLLLMIMADELLLLLIMRLVPTMLTLEMLMVEVAMVACLPSSFRHDINTMAHKTMGSLVHVLLGSLRPFFTVYEYVVVQLFLVPKLVGLHQGFLFCA